MRSDAVGWPSCSISCFIIFSLFGFSFIHSLLLSALSPFCHCADFSVAFLSYLVHTRFLPFLFVLIALSQTSFMDFIFHLALLCRSSSQSFCDHVGLVSFSGGRLP
ncbi:hypothetical protein C8J56DRAFT_965905 [Mycena floridula]|nr:hypothetical protein C8J56DRAFT_965905 [Mycena floridula]